MFTCVHRTSVVLSLVCVLTVLYAQPLVARSATPDVIPEVASTTQPEPVLPQNNQATYPIEGIPGGDAIVGDFVVGPGKVDVTLKPGETKVVEMIVTNRTGERRVFNLTTEDAEGSNDPATPIVLLGKDRGPYSLKEYMSVPYTSFELNHNERARIPVTISIPEDAEPGGLYGSMLVDTVAIRAQSGESDNTVPQTAIIARIGTLFFITVPGVTEHALTLTEFGTLGKKKLYGSGPVVFGILHANTGSIHAAPYGEMRITNIFDEEVGSVELEPWFVLPKSQRLREITWNRDFLFGRYVATVEINRSYEDVIDTASFTFWVLPWKILLGVFGTLFVVLFLIRTFLRTFEFKRKS